MVVGIGLKKWQVLCYNGYSESNPNYADEDL